MHSGERRSRNGSKAGLSIGIPALGGYAVVVDGPFGAAFHAETGFIAPAEIIGRADVALPGRKLIPFDSLCGVLLDAAPAFVGDAKLTLRTRMPLLGSLPEQMGRFL